MIRQKEVSKPSAVRVGITHGKRLEEASAGDFVMPSARVKKAYRGCGLVRLSWEAG